MSDNAPVNIVVGPNDLMPQVLARLRARFGMPATVTIPSSSSLFLTASEFRALKSEAEYAHVALTVETDDRLRRQLATMFGLPVVDLLPTAVAQLPKPASAPTAKRIALVPAATPAPAPAPPSPPAVAHPAGSNGASAGEEIPTEKPLPEATVAAKPTEASAATTVVVKPAEADVPGEAQAEPERKGPSARSLPISGRALALVAGAVVALLLVALAAAFFLQSATVTLTTKRQPVEANLLFAVTGPEAEPPSGALFAIPAAPVDFEVPFAETIPVTGVLREPGEPAVGNVQLRNSAESEVQIAAGTAFATFEGVRYVFVGDVTVPAAGADGAGRAEADVRAEQGGENANLAIGALTGRLENGVYFSNRDAPVSGGTETTTPVVDQADIDRLIALANERLPEQARSFVLTDGRTVLPGTVQSGEIAYSVDHRPGDPAETVSIEARMTANALAFDPAEARTNGTEMLQTDLQAAAAQGYELDPATITVAAPVLVNDQGAAAVYRLAATAQSRAVVDDATRDALADTIAGDDPEEAAAYLREQPFVDAVAIDSSPGFLPERIPGNAGRIEFETR